MPVIRAVTMLAAAVMAGNVSQDAAIAAPAAASVAPVVNDGRADFDFIDGRWKVANRRLKKSGTNDWYSFEMDYEGWTAMGGRADFDHMYGPLNGQYFEGVAVRTFNPATKDWTIYWMAIRDPEMTEQVRGHFDGNVGTFISTDRKTRFIWRKLGPDRAHWEQAVPLPDGRWETNWTMDFRRVGGHLAKP